MTSQNKDKKDKQEGKDFQLIEEDSDNEESLCFGSERYYLMPSNLVTIENDSDTGGEIPTDESDEVFLLTVETERDTDTDETGDQLRKQYLEKFDN